MLAPTAITARLERTLSNSSPPGSWLKQAGDAARSENQPYICLRPFLVGEISSNVGAEACQYGRQEKIDAVEAVKARTRSRHVCSTK